MVTMHNTLVTVNVLLVKAGLVLTVHLATTLMTVIILMIETMSMTTETVDGPGDLIAENAAMATAGVAVTLTGTGTCRGRLTGNGGIRRRRTQQPASSSRRVAIAQQYEYNQCRMQASLSCVL